MGPLSSICGENLFSQLKEKYGETFIKLVVAEKSKETINQQFVNITKQAQDQFSGFQGKTTSLVTDQSNNLKQIFDSFKQKAESLVPGGVSAIQRMKGSSIQEISGYNKLQGSIDGIKTDTFSKISTQKNNVLDELTGKKNGMINQIEEQRPKIPLYQDLPQPVKTALLDEGSKQFASQISQNKEGIMKQIASKLNLGNLTSLFSQISPESTLQNLVGNAGSQFLSNLGLGNVGGGLSGMAGNLMNGGNIGNALGNIF